MKQTLSTEDISASQDFLRVKTPNTDPAPSQLPLEAGSATPRPVFHPSHCLRLERARPV